jgi:DNA-binding transcriptional LysR family regulator
VIPRLAGFLSIHPDLDIEVILDDRNVDLIEGGIDVALRIGDLADSTLTARKIGQSRRLVIGAPAYFAKRGEPTSPTELADHQAIVYSIRGGGSTWVFRRGLEEIPATLKGRVRVNAAEGVREAVFANLGLSVSSEWMFAPELASGKVRSVLKDWQLQPIDLWAVFPTGRKASAKARAFAEFIEAELAASPPTAHEEALRRASGA